MQLISHLLKPLLLCCLIGTTQTALAASVPSGAMITAGSGTIAQFGSALTITQLSQNMVIDWSSYNIDPAYQVHFIQPNSSAAVLNRTIGGDISNIFGQLSSNGSLLMIDSSGFVFGPDAQVNVGGNLVISSLNISDVNFLAGNYIFDSSTANGGSIFLGGSLSAASITLMTGNSGSINLNGSINFTGSTGSLSGGSNSATLCSGPCPPTTGSILTSNTGTIVLTGGTLTTNTGSTGGNLILTGGTLTGGTLNLTAVPLPPAIALLLSGLSLLGFTSRRRAT